jgi:hypothetical protein
MFGKSTLWSIGSVALVVLSLMFFAFIEQYYCPSADDFSGIMYASEGAPGFSYANQFYLNWEGPYLSQFLMGLLIRIFIITGSTSLVLGIPKLALILAASVFVRSLGARLNLGWSWSQSCLSAVVFTLSLYLISPTQSEIWHWLIGAVYLWPVIYALLASALILRGRLYLASIPVAFLMHSRITYGALILGALILFTASQYLRKSVDRKGWLIISLVAFFSLLVYVVAPGNYVRLSEHGNTLPFMISQFKVGISNLLFSYNLAKIDRVVILLLTIAPILLRSHSIVKKRLNWHLFIPAAAYLGFVVSHGVLFVVLTGYCEWTRVLSFHSFLFLMCCLFYGFILYGLIPSALRKRGWPLSFFGIIGLLLYLQSGYKSEVLAGQELQYEYSERMKEIKSHLGEGDTLMIKKINYSGVLYFEDFSEDPDHWINKDFAKAYDLKFKIAAYE